MNLQCKGLSQDVFFITKQTRYLESFQGSGCTHYTEEYRQTEIFYKFKGLLTFYVFYHFISKKCHTDITNNSHRLFFDAFAYS